MRCSLTDKQKEVLNWVLLIICFGVLFFAIYASPYESDDLFFIDDWSTNSPLTSINQIIEPQLIHYMRHTGRTVGHVILQVLLIIDKPINSLLTTICYFVVIFCICKLALDKVTIEKYLITLGLFYFLNTAFHETVLWTTGAANYLWTLMFALLSLLPATVIWKGQSIRWYFWPLLIVSFLAGWSNENIAPILVLLLAYIVYDVHKVSGKWNCWLILDCVFTCAGCGFLLLCPGNYARANRMNQSLLMDIAYRGYGQLNSFFNWLLLAWTILIVTLILMKRTDSHPTKLSKTYMLSALLSVLIWMGSPSYPQRGIIGTLALILISVMNNFEQLDVKNQRIFKLIGYAFVFGFVAVMLSTGVLAYARGLGADIPG